jgi:hypothetical protein
MLQRARRNLVKCWAIGPDDGRAWQARDRMKGRNGHGGWQENLRSLAHHVPVGSPLRSPVDDLHRAGNFFIKCVLSLYRVVLGRIENLQPDSIGCREVREAKMNARSRLHFTHTTHAELQVSLRFRIGGSRTVGGRRHGRERLTSRSAPRTEPAAKRQQVSKDGDAASAHREGPLSRKFRLPKPSSIKNQDSNLADLIRTCTRCESRHSSWCERPRGPRPGRRRGRASGRG